MNRSQRKLLADEEMLHRRALSMAIRQTQLSQRFDGSMSKRVGSTSTRKQQRTLSDPFSNAKQVSLLLTHIFQSKSSHLLLILYDYLDCVVAFLV